MPPIPKRRTATSTAAVDGFVIALAAVSVFPLFWMISTAFKPFDEIYQFPPALFPSQVTLGQFERLFGVSSGFTRMIGNSILVSTTTTLITMVLAAMAGYGLAKGRFRGRRLLLRSTLLAYVFPPILLVVPLFGILADLGYANTLPGLIAVYLIITFPFAVWLLTSYFATLPTELTEAARIDGASNMRAFWSIALPLTRPGLAAVAIFTFINTWNEFLFAFVIVGGGQNRTASVGLSAILRGAEGAEYGVLMAGSLIAMIPIIILFVFAQKHIVAGLTGGAVKG
ncbi:carbohydrate ABC transporter permease [Occultella gossypii]|uniref:Carbohydrate ABC transporter permease n=1 Tax=Occultella gossypii TaxID=2800820 RepID=A0ABS7S2W4_9MICO|nr:carbohydrate ABC transporter permease [Occultella gossypii]MBZ2194673.1 carbohydrate ABC transporter permease [Occultella gossypii]